MFLVTLSFFSRFRIFKKYSFWRNTFNFFFAKIIELGQKIRKKTKSAHPSHEKVIFYLGIIGTIIVFVHTHYYLFVYMYDVSLKILLKVLNLPNSLFLLFTQ